MSIFTISTKIYFVEMNYLCTQFIIDGYGLYMVHKVTHSQKISVIEFNVYVEI